MRISILSVLLFHCAPCFIPTSSLAVAHPDLQPWSDIVTQAMVGYTLRSTENPMEPLNPLENLMVGGRILSILHLSQWQAINEVLAATNFSSLSAAIEQLPSLHPLLINTVAAAGNHVLTNLLPDGAAQAEISALCAAQARESRLPSGTGEDSGAAESSGPTEADLALAKRLGEATGKAVLESRRDDGTSRSIPPYVGATTASGVTGARDDKGRWRPTPPAFSPGGARQWKDATPYVLSSPGELRPPPPPDLRSPSYQVSYMEVATVGNRSSDERQPSETESAIFWTAQPDALLFAVVGQVTEEMDLLEATRTYALASVAAVDARVAIMDGKYFYSSWRPVTALPLGNGVGLPAFPDFAPYLTTPPTPEYPSGHAVHGEAIVEVLRRARGGGRGLGGEKERAADACDVVLTTPTVQGESGGGARRVVKAEKQGRGGKVEGRMSGDPPGQVAPQPMVVTRRYASLSEVSEDLALSRIFGGIHYRFTAEQSLEMGVRVGRRVVEGFDAKYTKLTREEDDSAQGARLESGGGKRGLRVGGRDGDRGGGGGVEEEPGEGKLSAAPRVEK